MRELEVSEMDEVGGGFMHIIAIFVAFANGANAIENPPEWLEEDDWGGWDFSGAGGF